MSYLEWLLHKRLTSFELQEALALSDSIHDFEAAGGELVETEDVLWSYLTSTIEDARALQRS